MNLYHQNDGRIIESSKYLIFFQNSNAYIIVFIIELKTLDSFFFHNNMFRTIIQGT